MEHERFIRILIGKLGGSVTITSEDQRVAGDTGVLIKSEDALGTLTYTLSCVDGHTPDDPAPGRAVCCRTCLSVLEGGKP